MVRVVIEKVRILGICCILKVKGRVVVLSPAQWSSSVQLLQLASLCLHGTYLNYITDCHSMLCWSVVNAVTV